MSQHQYNIVSNILIPHTSFNAAISRISQCLKVADGSAEPICIAIIGESRAGKTRVLEHMEAQYPRTRLDDGLRITILRVTTPANPTVKGLASEILAALGDLMPDKGTERNMTRRIVTLVRESGTRMIMVDEFQHFFDKEKNRVKHHVADWFKVLVDTCKVALVVSGLPSCQAVLNQNEQLAGRFLAPIHMPRFDWKDNALRNEFIAILDAFQNGLPQFDLPQLDSDEMAFRFYCATGGLIGYMAKILRQAIWTALDSETNQITLDDLACAYQESVYKDEASSALPKAFDRGFILHVNEALLKQVSAIGTSIPEEHKERASSRKLAAHSAGDVLRT